MKFIRWFLGKVILTLSFIFSPKGIKRSEELQKELDKKASSLALYQFEACPFCVKVRRAMQRQSITFDLRDAKNNPTHREALLTHGGALKVPCLRIDNGDETTWMYESSDIVAYLEKEFA
ncbi:glutaredoxin family protein [Vibrio algarum]|uniref:Glutaredoxin n=1 Tax=Vibrio algarum TaxID=3020714 RepID=A0ABT4YSN5_9VIBR|nr:glutaredoxin [Vibrio sp. KJ40-1]MDB1124078.1 glutaredoxin [Vibrio sp. KJ40-1]